MPQTDQQAYGTYADLKPGDRVLFDDRPPSYARLVDQIRKAPPIAAGNPVVEIICTDGHAVEVLADLPLRIDPHVPGGRESAERNRRTDKILEEEGYASSRMPDTELRCQCGTWIGAPRPGEIVICRTCNDRFEAPLDPTDD